MVHIYYGDGKGKTTAAVGLAMRAAGHDIPVIFAQFLKQPGTGEVVSFRKRYPEIICIHDMPCPGFYYEMNEAQKKQTQEAVLRIFDKATQMSQELARTSRVMLVLDEVLHVCQMGLLMEEELLRFLSGCQSNVEVILTGQNPTEGMLAMAEYVTEMKKVRHPYDYQKQARVGVEW